MIDISRRTLLQGTAVAAATSFLAACSRGASSGSSTSVNLMYDWTYNGPTGTVAKYWNTVSSRLKSAGGAQLGQLDQVPFEAIYQQVSAIVTAGSGASLATYYADYATFKLANAKQVAPLDQYVGSESKHWLLATTKFGGSYYGAPHVVEALVLVINRKLFDQASVQVEGRFGSYDAFIEACGKLKAAGITPIQAGTSDGPGAEAWFQMAQLQVCNSPAELLQTVAGDLPADGPLFAQTFQKIIDLRSKYMNASPNNDTNQDAADKFLRGEAAMAIVYPAAVSGASVGSEFEVIGFPASDAKFNRPAVASGDTVMLMDYAENKEAAGEILKFLHQPEQLKLWWNLTGSLPSDDRFDSSVLPTRLKVLWNMITERRDNYSLWWPDNFYPSSVALPLVGVMQDTFAGSLDAAAATAKANALFTTFCKENAAELEVVKANAASLQSVS